MSANPETDRWAAQAADFIAQQWAVTPRVGIILGTGAGPLAEAIDVECELAYQDIPNFPASTALGHRGRLFGGQLANTPVVAFQGRFHLYEGYDLRQVTLPISVMHRLGIEWALITNAAGGVNPDFRPGELMLIDSFLDLMFTHERPTTPLSSRSLPLPRPSSRVDVALDQRLIARASELARRHNFAMHRGVYAGLVGPTYETRAEYRMLRRIGADAVGMSTIPEINAASRLEMRVLAISVISNVAHPDVLEVTSGHEVIRAAEKAAGPLTEIALGLIQETS